MNLISCVQILPRCQLIVLPEHRGNLAFLVLCFFIAFVTSGYSKAAKLESTTSESMRLESRQSTLIEFVPGTLQKRVFSQKGISRSYWLYIPTRLHSKPTLTDKKGNTGLLAAPALMTVLHGSHQSGEAILFMSDLVAHAEKHKYILLAPNAEGTAFNDGSNRVEPQFRKTSDTHFLLSLNAYIKSALATDSSKNYLVGFSSGASMAQRVAAESQGEFTAVVSVSDHYWGPARGEVSPVSMLFIFGDSDPLNPISGGKVFHSQSLTLTVPKPMQTAQEWAQTMGCSTAITATIEPVKQRKWVGCREKKTVMYLEVSKLGHFWAGGKVRAYERISEREVGPYHAGFITTLVIWDYLNKL